MAVIITSKYKIRCVQSSSKTLLFLMSCLSLILLNSELSRIVHYATHFARTTNFARAELTYFPHELRTLFFYTRCRKFDFLAAFLKSVWKIEIPARRVENS